MIPAREVEKLCARYAANETATLQQRLSRVEQQLADSQRTEAGLRKDLHIAEEKLAADEAEIAQMSRELAALRLRVPAGGQAAVQQHPRAPMQNHANLPLRPPPAAPRQQEMQQRPQQQNFNLGAQPFLPARPALPAPPPPQQQQQQALALVRRPALPLPPAQGPAPEIIPAHGPAPKAMPNPPNPQRLLPGTPKHADDVFDPSIPDSMPWRPAEFDKKPTRELLDAAFCKVKGTVYSQPWLSIPQSRLPGERSFIGLGIRHLDRAKQVYDMLREPPRYISLISGIINSLLVDKILTQGAILNYPQDQEGHMATFISAYQEEQKIQYPNAVMDDYDRRYNIAQARAIAAKNVQRLPRFWMWIGQRANLIAEEITAMVNITIAHNREIYKASIAQAANELLRIHIRMLQETSTYNLEFVGAGHAWVSDSMLNRDPAIMGQQLPDKNCPWVTQCTITPLVTEEVMEKSGGMNPRVFISKEVLLKAEVTLCERRGNLRQ